jgi:kynureninase
MNTWMLEAQNLDEQDELSVFRSRFHIPPTPGGEPSVYFCGNSLGLMPKSVRENVEEVLYDWQNLGVEGHVHAKHPWMPYHEFLTDQMAAVVGALPEEVVVMNSLTVNIHLMMVSFYRPTAQRYKILMEYAPFPSDRYALESQVKFHGFDPQTAIIELMPDPETKTITREQIDAVLAREGEHIALIMIGGVNYYTGQAYDIAYITRAGHQYGCIVGFDLAHGAGNLHLQLHDDGPDFAAWCGYKYLNSGPGALSGCFVHQRHARDFELPRFAGWWGHDKKTRFLMGNTFIPIPGAEGWQLSNPPILPMASMRASLQIFQEAGMSALRLKSEKMTHFALQLLKDAGLKGIRCITPSDPQSRGCQLSLQMINPDKRVFEMLTARGVIADWREPDVIRIAPVPLYNSYSEIATFVTMLNDILAQN